MSSTEQNTTEQIVTKKKKIKVLPFIIIGIIILVVVAALAVLVVNGVVAASTEKKVQEQLDLGERYLQELDYEQAIVAYTTAIEIDPKNVDAYLGLSDVYVAMDDYDRAIEVLEQGYDETEDEKIKDRMEELTEEIEEMSEEEQESVEAESEEFENESADAEVEDDSLPREAVPGEVVDGIYHNPYYEYDLSEDSLTYLNGIFEEIEAGNGEAVAEELDYQMISEIIDETVQDSVSAELVQYAWDTADGKIPGSMKYANIFLNDMKVHVRCTDIEYSVVRIYILPVEDGEGYLLYHFQDAEDVGYIYSTINCVNGVPDGEFTIQSTEPNGYAIYKGTVVGGLLDGEATATYYIDEVGKIENPVMFDMGKLQYSDLTMDENGDIRVKMRTFSTSPFVVKDTLDTKDMDVAIRYLDGVFTLDIWLGLDANCSVYGTEVDGGMRYYEW